MTVPSKETRMPKKAGKRSSIQGGAKGHRMYNHLKAKGHSKSSAAKITNAAWPPGKSKKGYH